MDKTKVENENSSRPRYVWNYTQGTWRFLGFVTVAQITASIFDQGVPTLAPFLKASFGLSLVATGMLVTIGNLGRSVASFPGGRIVDQIGVRRALIVVLGALAVLTFAASFSTNFFLLAALLVGGGLCTAFTNPAGARLIAVRFSAKQRGLAMAIRQGAVPLGGLIGAILLPKLAATGSWRMSFRFIAGGAVIGMIISIGLPRRQRRQQTGDNALPKATLSVTRQILGNHSILLLISWGMVMIIAQYSFPTFIALYLRAIRGTSVLTASGLIVVAQLGGIAGRVLFGALSDRMGGRRWPFMYITTLLSAVTALALSQVSSFTPIWTLGVLALAYGVSAIGWNGLWLTSLIELSAVTSSASVVGMSLAFANLAVIGGVTGLGFIEKLSGNFRLIWITLAVILALSMSLLAINTDLMSGDKVIDREFN